MAAIILSVFALQGCGSSGPYAERGLKDDPDRDYAADEENQATSYSGKYLLSVVLQDGTDGKYLNLAINEKQMDGTWQLVFAPGPVDNGKNTGYSAQHTTVFVWDRKDRVWVYSGDIGTFVYSPEPDRGWARRSLYEMKGEVAPGLLRRFRPSSFQ